MSTTEKKQGRPPSRYQRVQQVLTAAAAGSQADYQGLGPFWELPYEEFLVVEIYGVRMIAPASATGTSASSAGAPGQAGATQKKGCCPAGGVAASTPSAAPASPSWTGATRSARSGLIRGLRGDFPFDGSHFPRLPWGGAAVSGPDIQFIAQWIDDGCPQNDDSTSAGEGDGAGSCPHHGGGASGGQPGRVEPANHFHHGQEQPKVRKNYEYLSATELAELRRAVAARSGEISTPTMLRNGRCAASSSTRPLPQPRSTNEHVDGSTPIRSSIHVVTRSGEGR